LVVLLPQEWGTREGVVPLSAATHRSTSRRLAVVVGRRRTQPSSVVLLRLPREWGTREGVVPLLTTHCGTSRRLTVVVGQCRRSTRRASRQREGRCASSQAGEKAASQLYVRLVIDVRVSELSEECCAEFSPSLFGCGCGFGEVFFGGGRTRAQDCPLLPRASA